MYDINEIDLSLWQQGMPLVSLVLDPCTLAQYTDSTLIASTSYWPLMYGLDFISLFGVAARTHEGPSK
jgi:hypothetical protein